MRDASKYVRRKKHKRDDYGTEAVDALLDGAPLDLVLERAAFQSVHSQGKPARRGARMPKTPSGQPRARVVESGQEKIGDMSAPFPSYAAGYRAGSADRRLGIRSEYAEAPEHGDYAVGYRHGVLGIGWNAPARKPA